MMESKRRTLRPNQRLPGQTRGSGRVRAYQLGDRRRLYQITTFCPENEGPGATHLYLIEDKKLILLDTGIPTALVKNLFYRWRGTQLPEAVASLPDDFGEQQLLSAIQLTGHDVKDIDYIVLSHGHYDHYTMGNRLVQLSGARVAAHVFDAGRIANRYALLEYWMKRVSSIVAMGMPLPKVSWSKRKGVAQKSDDPLSVDLSLRVDYPITSDGPLRIDDFVADSVSVRSTAGHTSGGISLLLETDGAESVLLCGDTILHPTTPQPDDLIAYLRTLKNINTIDNVVLTLPAHGSIINDLYGRIAFLEKHHERRLRLTYEICKRPSCIWRIATTERFFDVYVDPKAFNPLAAQEAFVHVELLQTVKGLYRSHIKDDVHYFENSGERFEEVYERVQAVINNTNTTALRRF